MEKSRTISELLLLVTFALCIISIVVLPDPVITQFSVGDTTKTPKVIAIAIPLLLGVGGSMYSIMKKDDSFFSKSDLISVLAIVIFIVMLVVNMS